MVLWFHVIRKVFEHVTLSGSSYILTLKVKDILVEKEGQSAFLMILLITNLTVMIVTWLLPECYESITVKIISQKFENRQAGHDDQHIDSNGCDDRVGF